MCDTFVALSPATQDASVILGKNSDREPNEAHEVIIFPARDYPAGESLRCTYLEIPQVRHTHAVVLAKPFWIWGAEMGANEFGVAIGNEAVFTRLGYETAPGLIGMDLLRLALERASTAEEALWVITNLLDQYGQGGNCGFSHPFYYHNSFLIADPGEAWVLETAGKEWAAERVRDTRSISNRISIGTRWDRASQNLVSTAVARGWCKSQVDFDFAACYSDFVYTRFSAASHRQTCTSRLLEQNHGGIDVTQAMSFLRSHGANSDMEWRPDRSLTGAEVCMHAGFGPIRVSQSTGSFIAHLLPGKFTFWVTGTSAPCTGVFKPVWLDVPLPWTEPQPRGSYDPACLWWRHERLHRAVLLNYPLRMHSLIVERQDLEADFILRSNEARTPDERSVVAHQCYDLAEHAEQRWLGEALLTPKGGNAIYYDLAWKGFNRQALLSV